MPLSTGMDTLRPGYHEDLDRHYRSVYQCRCTRSIRKPLRCSEFDKHNSDLNELFFCMKYFSLSLTVTTTIVAAGISVAAIAAGYFTFTAARRHRLKKRLSSTASLVTVPLTASSTWSVDDSEEQVLAREQLSRNESFFGQEGLDSCRKAFVIVVGLGGVGSHAAVHLLRSGVTRLRLIDFDQVTLSSLNRHACATRADVGRPKVLAIRSYLRTIFPGADIDARVELFNRDRADDLLGDQPQFVLDCIDNMETKIDLLEYCSLRGIPVISSMGSACKSDPTRIHIADISATSEDKLARAVRSKLRQRGIAGGVPVVYSTERPKVSIMPLPVEPEDQPGELAALPNFRVRILPVLGALPAIFGSAMAAYVLCRLAGFEMEPLGIRNQKSIYQRIYRDLLASAPLCVELRDVAWLYEDVWSAKSAISGQAEQQQLTLQSWSATLPATLPHNLVLMTKPEAERHKELITSGGPVKVDQYYSADVLERIERRLLSVKEEFRQ